MEEIFRILIERLFTSPDNIVMGVIDPFTAVAIGSGIIKGIGAIFGGSRAKKRRRAAERKAARLESEITHLENTRQEIINPFAGVTDLSSMASDLSGLAKDTSGNLSNPYANLGVATGAAEMQAEEADIALANTLDTLASTGASAGGATALAQMALKSKQGVANSIEMQEKQNNDLRAQGEEKLQTQKMQEQQRIQGVQIGEGQRMQGVGMNEASRVQQAGVQGEMFMFEERDKREMQKLNRKSAQLTGQNQAAAQARQDGSRALATGLSAVGDIAGGVAQAYKD
tara:strand:+ start:1756 stop:2610 length:855 start_codon:yes stop_codon:yes gene_type:complete